MKRLSKTDFFYYLDAPMHLWALAHGQIEAGSPSAYEQHLAQQGQQVESLARDYIEMCLLPEYDDGQLFWQTPFADQKFEIRTDALILNLKTEKYDLIEIKSSTSVHPEHIIDVAFQRLVLEAFLKIDRVFILHVDKTYQHGKALDLAGFLTIEEVSDRVQEKLGEVAVLQEDAYQILHLESPQPSFACTKPGSCPCPNLCHPDLPPYPIYQIPRIGKKAADLREMGITRIEDIPESYPLNAIQKQHTRAVKGGQPLVDITEIQNTLAKLEYPLYFLDYETFNPAVPLFPHYHPYEHITFQYSLFVMEDQGSTPQHFDCLLTDAQDPAPRIVPDLLSHLGPAGHVIVWNQSFDAGRNLDLARHYPVYAHDLQSLNDRLFDLMLIFRKGYYIHPDFHGSASLKAVLPVLCPDLSYEDLVISSGEEAMLSWYQIQKGEIPPEQRPGVEAAMKAYCQRDTYGMVAILQHLWQVTRSKDEY